MAKHLQRELESLQEQLLSLASIVEEQVRTAVRAVEKIDVDTAKLIIDSDRKVDLLEIEVEEECLKILALHQPVAVDLRFIIAVLKINYDLERIGDLAGNIADRAIALARLPDFSYTSRLTLMCEKAMTMLNKCLDAFFTMTTTKALEVCRSDDEVDELYREMVTIVRDGIKANIKHVEGYLFILSVARHLERIADHATNIAEDVLYMLEGGIVRHRSASTEPSKE